MELLNWLRRAVLLGMGFAAFLPLGAVADPILDDVLAGKELRIASDPTELPFLLRTPKGKYEGFEADLAKAIVEKIGQGTKIKWVSVNWGRIAETVKTGKAHLGMSGMFIPEGGKEGDWGVYSNSYYRTGLALAYKAAKGNLGLEEIKKVKPVVGIFSDPKATAVFEQLKLPVKVFDGDETPLDALKAGKIEVAAYDYPAVVKLVKEDGKKYHAVLDFLPGSEGDYGILLSKAATDLLARVNDGINMWKQDPQRKIKWKDYMRD